MTKRNFRKNEWFYFSNSKKTQKFLGTTISRFLSSVLVCSQQSSGSFTLPDLGRYPGIFGMNWHPEGWSEGTPNVVLVFVWPPNNFLMPSQWFRVVGGGPNRLHPALIEAYKLHPILYREMRVCSFLVSESRERSIYIYIYIYFF